MSTTLGILKLESLLRLGRPIKSGKSVNTILLLSSVFSTFLTLRFSSALDWDVDIVRFTPRTSSGFFALTFRIDDLSTEVDGLNSVSIIGRDFFAPSSLRLGSGLRFRVVGGISGDAGISCNNLISLGRFAFRSLISRGSLTDLNSFVLSCSLLGGRGLVDGRRSLESRFRLKT